MQVIGRVPANICKIFKELITSNQVKKMTFMSTDDLNISKVPPSQQSFRKNQHGFDQRGGGGIIPCRYIIYCYDSTFEKVRKILHESLKELKFQGTETLLFLLRKMNLAVLLVLGNKNLKICIFI